jgi:hypothetical protein
MGQCALGKVWVSGVVTDLVAGAGLTFAEHGLRELKGLPGHWDLFAASAQSNSRPFASFCVRATIMSLSEQSGYRMAGKTGWLGRE